MFRPYWPPLDDPKTVSFDVAARLADAGFKGGPGICRLGWGKRGEDDFYRLYPLEEGKDDLLPAPSATELLAFYLDVRAKELGVVTVVCQGQEYLATNGSCRRLAATLDDAVGELVLWTLGDRRCSHPL